ncbi:hypothetical protein E2C01_032574 [Portunus trituberculatus]|uniref:Uncharacterized protein n=1 Tax=Portunus trituberculatus TaxID=210409 RepID=A0A5B7EZZ7_PORTR|nr:hypothetical protein [Portunus trituberculatus]
MRYRYGRRMVKEKVHDGVCVERASVEQGPLPGCPGVRAWAGVFETGWVEEGAQGGRGEGGHGLAGCQRRTYLAAVIVPASTWPDSTGIDSQALSFPNICFPSSS